MVRPPAGFRDRAFLNGFAQPDNKFRFRPDWRKAGADKPAEKHGPEGPVKPAQFPDYWPSMEEADEAHPFRLATSPARNFLNSSFTETPTSRDKEGRPELMIPPADAAGKASPTATGSTSAMRAANSLHAQGPDLTKRGVVIAEGLWPNKAHDRRRHQCADRRRSRRPPMAARPARQSGLAQIGGGLILFDIFYFFFIALAIFII